MFFTPAAFAVGPRPHTLAGGLRSIPPGRFPWLANILPEGQARQVGNTDYAFDISPAAFEPAPPRAEDRGALAVAADGDDAEGSEAGEAGRQEAAGAEAGAGASADGCSPTLLDALRRLAASRTRRGTAPLDAKERSAADWRRRGARRPQDNYLTASEAQAALVAMMAEEGGQDRCGGVGCHEEWSLRKVAAHLHILYRQGEVRRIQSGGGWCYSLGAIRPDADSDDHDVLEDESADSESGGSARPMAEDPEGSESAAAVSTKLDSHSALGFGADGSSEDSAQSEEFNVGGQGSRDVEMQVVRNDDHKSCKPEMAIAGSGCLGTDGISSIFPSTAKRPKPVSDCRAKSHIDLTEEGTIEEICRHPEEGEALQQTLVRTIVCIDLHPKFHSVCKSSFPRIF